MFRSVIAQKAPQFRKLRKKYVHVCAKTQMFNNTLEHLICLAIICHVAAEGNNEVELQSIIHTRCFIMGFLTLYFAEQSTIFPFMFGHLTFKYQLQILVCTSDRSCYVRSHLHSKS